MRQNHQLPRVQNYSVLIVKSRAPSSRPCRTPFPFIGEDPVISPRDFIRACHFPKSEIYIYSVRLYTHNALARAMGRFTFIYTNVYGGISTYFPSRSLLFFSPPPPPLFSPSILCFFTARAIRHCRNANYTGSRTKHLIDIVAYHATILFSITTERLLSHG